MQVHFELQEENDDPNLIIQKGRQANAEQKSLSQTGKVAKGRAGSSARSNGTIPTDRVIRESTEKDEIPLDPGLEKEKSAEEIEKEKILQRIEQEHRYAINAKAKESSL